VSVRNIVSGVTGYMLVGALERALSLAILPITTRLFAPTDFAQLIAINNITAILNLFVGLFLVRGMTPVVAALPDEAVRRDAVTSIVWATAGLCVVSFSAVWLLAPAIGHALNQPEGFAALLRLALAAMFVATLGQTMMALSRTLERHALVVKVQVLALVGQAIVMLHLLLNLRWGLASVFWATFMAGAIALLGYLAWLVGWLRGRPTTRHLRSATLMGAHLLALNIGALLMLNSAGLILNYVGRPDEAAAFGIASAVASIGMLAAIAFDSVWTAHIMRRRNDPEVQQLAVRMFDLHSAVFLVASAAGALFAHEIFMVIVGPRFVPAYALVPPLIGCYALFSFARNFGQGLLLQAQPRRSAWIGLATAALFFAIGVPAAYGFGAYGLLGAMTTAFVAFLITVQIESFRAFPISYPWRTHAALWGGAGVVIHLMAYREPSWTTAAFKAAALSCIAFVAFVRLRAISSVDSDSMGQATEDSER
jgi:O-antigen/teichoic acid export membrane protein